MRKRNQNSRPPQDGSPVKLLFGLYQCLHHLSSLAGNANPGNEKPFTRKVEELDRFFIPALPSWNSKFKEQCHETNEKWRHEQIQNLNDHYEYCTEALKGAIWSYYFTPAELTAYLAQAKKWAQQTFGKKFKIAIFEKVDQMVQNLPTRKTTVKEPKPGNSKQIQTKTGNAAALGETSTPKRKRGQTTSPTSSPVTDLTPKRPKRLSYAEKTKSPLIRPHAETQAANPAVTTNRRLEKHERGNLITEAWKIPKVTKDILVLGTSNLARVSFVNRRDAQVVSYPGLKLYMMTKLLAAFKFGSKSTNPGQQPSHVIFSIGINDRNSAPATFKTELKKLINEAKRQFPDSKISIYQQPFDQKLSRDETLNLTEFNAFVEQICKSKGLNCIPRLPKAKFAVTPRDPIHWTENCANATVDHFFAHLN